MNLNIKRFTIGKYTLLLLKSLTTSETEQWYQHKREADAQVHIRAIEGNKKYREEHLQRIKEVEAGQWDWLIEAYQRIGEKDTTTREAMIAEARQRIAWCERNLAWMEAHPVRS